MACFCCLHPVINRKTALNFKSFQICLSFTYTLLCLAFNTCAIQLQCTAVKPEELNTLDLKILKVGVESSLFVITNSDQIPLIICQYQKSAELNTDTCVLYLNSSSSLLTHNTYHGHIKRNSMF